MRLYIGSVSETFSGSPIKDTYLLCANNSIDRNCSSFKSGQIDLSSSINFISTVYHFANFKLNK